MSGESERIEEVGKYIEATIAEIDNHAGSMESCSRWIGGARTARCMKLSSTRMSVIEIR